MREKLLRGIYKIVRRRSWWVLGISILLTLLSLAYIRQLEIRSSFLDLLPRDDPLRIIYQRREETIQHTDLLAIRLALLERPGSAQEGVEQLKRAAEALIQKLKESEEIDFADYRVGFELPQLNPFFASIEELQALASYVEKIRESLGQLEGKEKYTDSFKAASEALARAIQVDEAAEVDVEVLTQQLAKLSELTKEVKGMLQELPERVGQAGAGIELLLKNLESLEEKLKPRENFSKDQRALLVIVRPRWSSQRSLEYNQKITRLVQDAIHQAGLHEMGVVTKLAGPYVLSTESNQIIQRDTWRTTIISSIGILLVFILAFGNVFYPLLAAIPLFMALFMTLAWAKLSVGGLNLVTAFLPPIILGLGIDYGIHFISHYTEERQRGLRIGPALESTLVNKGSAMLTAALTTSFVLFGLIAANSPGLFEMGVIAGVGILLSAFATLMVLPALIILSHIVLKKRFQVKPRRYRLDLTRLFRGVLARRKPIIIGVLAATLFMLLPAVKLEFKFISEEMIPKNLKSQEALSVIREEFELGATEIGEYFVFVASSEEEMHRIVGELKKIELIDSISSIEGLTERVLEAKDKIIQQMNLIGELERGRTVLAHFEANLIEKERFLAQIRNLMGFLSYLMTLASAAGRGDLSVELSDSIQALLELNRRLEELNAEQLSKEVGTLKDKLNILEGRLQPIFQVPKPQIADLPEAFQKPFLTKKGEFVIYARVKGAQLYREEYFTQLIEQVKKISDEVFGTPLIRSKLEENMLRDFWVTTLIAVFVIIILLWIDFRRTLSIPTLRFGPLLAMFPLALGYIWMLGSMKLLNLHLNFANILISPLLVGLGIGFSVYILHRYAQERNIEKAVGATALPIVMAAVTTMIGFGSLLVADTPGLRMLGESALLGIGFTAIFSLLFLPAVIWGLTRVAERDKIKE